jgi:hypothetical protein
VAPSPIMGEQIERSTREGAEALRRKRAVGEGKANEGEAVVPLDGGKVIRFPGKRRVASGGASLVELEAPCRG